MNQTDYETYLEKKFHADPSFPYNTYICSIPLDFSEVSMHWHSYMEIIYIKKGKGYVNVNFQSHYVEGGDIIMVLPGEIHGISQYENQTMEYENIIFSIEMLMSKYADALDNEFFVPLLSHKLCLPTLICDDAPFYHELSECLNRADRICKTFSKGYQLAIKSYLTEFFYILYAQASDSENQKKAAVSERDLDRIKEILGYIQNHYKETITIDEISSACGLSASHFMRFFKNSMGTSFINYLNDYRLNVASRMLLSSEDSILVIATDCGFDNLSYFNRLFKKKYGQTPSIYRKVR